MKLISMTDFVLRETNSPTTLAESFQRCVTYVNFLKQPLKLEMFVPVDEEGNFIEEPLQEHYTDCTEEQNAKDWLYNLEKYEQAKEKVLFEGFILEKDELINNRILFWVGEFEGNENIENCISSNLTLTPNAIKQLGL